MNSNRKTDILVGLFLFCGLLMLGAIILEFGNLRSLWRETYLLRVGFPKAAGIKKGSPVYLGGTKVGKVHATPRLNEKSNGVVMDLEIYDSVNIPVDAAVAIGSDGLMGDAMIEIQPSGKEAKEFLAHNETKIIQGATSGDLQSQAGEVAKKVDLVLDDVRVALVDIKGAMTKINQGALAETTIQDFKQSMEHLNKAITKVDTQVLGDDNSKHLKTALADIEKAAASFKNSAKNVEDASKRLGPMFDKLDPALAKVDRVMSTADESLKSIKQAADSFATAARNITSGKGLLGALLNDPELKTEFKDLISNLKRNGVVFYRDNADKKRTTSSGASQSTTKTPAPARPAPQSRRNP
jgi:phospholipid/cholesterol/gamma-HCH transport system substrate-binding protein